MSRDRQHSDGRPSARSSRAWLTELRWRAAKLLLEPSTPPEAAFGLAVVVGRAAIVLIGRYPAMAIPAEFRANVHELALAKTRRLTDLRWRAAKLLLEPSTPPEIADALALAVETEAVALIGRDRTLALATEFDRNVDALTAALAEAGGLDTVPARQVLCLATGSTAP